MGTKNDQLATLKDLETLLFGITFPIACILCIIILVRRIRRRPLARYAPPAKRQMDPPKFSGKEEINPVDHDLAAVRDPSRDATSLPSACDILQPLSHLSSLPSSGYLATVLGRERRARATTTSAQRCLAEGEAQAAPADPPVVAPVDGDDATASHRRRANSDMTASRRGSSDESCAELEDPQSFAFSPTGWRMEGLEEEPSPSVPASEGPPQQVARRNHTVQYLHTVDEGGPRAWRRVMMEYS